MRKSLVSMAVAAGLAMRHALDAKWNGVSHHHADPVFVAGPGPVGKSWIVYGPQGCGKTRHADLLAEFLGCRAYVDEWDMTQGSFSVSNGWLYLAAERPAWVPAGARRCISLDEALALATRSRGLN